MAKLVNMKLDPKKQAEKYAPSAVAPDMPIYPWGLSLNLDDDVLDKLGEDLPAMDDTLILIARVKVTSLSANQSESGKHRSASLQITDMCLEADDGKAGTQSEALADRLYKKVAG